jgi:hypothetical protein
MTEVERLKISAKVVIWLYNYHYKATPEYWDKVNQAKNLLNYEPINNTFRFVGKELFNEHRNQVYKYLCDTYLPADKYVNNSRVNGRVIGCSEKGRVIVEFVGDLGRVVKRSFNPLSWIPLEAAAEAKSMMGVDNG